MSDTQRKTGWAWVVGTFFGAGMLKPGPGTYGSVAATLVWFVVAKHVSGHAMPFVTLAMVAVATLVGIPAATRVASESGRKDPQIVVIDEVAGQWLALTMAVPWMPSAIAALVLFRVFDIWKPWPVRKLEALPAGTGIVVDDLAAGVYALLLHALLVQPLLPLLPMLLHALHKR